jgi:hypothetical protein
MCIYGLSFLNRIEGSGENIYIIVTAGGAIFYIYSAVTKHTHNKLSVAKIFHVIF